MVHGGHIIITAYGFWLPNDPRGSWSDFVRSWELFLAGGPATKTSTRRSVAGRAHDPVQRERTKAALMYPPVHFTGLQARAIARGFADFAAKSGITIWACAILPEHVHLAVARHRYKLEQMSNLLKGAATTRLIEEGLHPLQSFASPGARPPRCFAARQWTVFLDDEQDIVRSIRYVEDNPEKDGRPRQRWRFVKPYLGLGQ